MLIHDTRAISLRFADDVLEALSFIRTAPRTWSSKSDVTIKAEPGWDLNLGYAGALAMAREGWQEGASKLVAGLDAFPPTITGHAVLKYDAAGYMPDVPRFLAGDPAHMVTRGRGFKERPIVHMVINPCALATVSASQMLNFGIAAAALVNRVEAGGRRVELDVLWCANAHSPDSRAYVATGWKVKGARDQLDVNNLAFALAHPAAFRRLCFAMRVRSAATFNTATIGWSAPLSTDIVNLLGADSDAWLINGIMRSTNRCFSAQDAMNYLVEQVGEERLALH